MTNLTLAQTDSVHWPKTTCDEDFFPTPQSKLNGSLCRHFVCIAVAETVRHRAKGEKRAPRTRFLGPSEQTRTRAGRRVQFTRVWPAQSLN